MQTYIKHKKSSCLKASNTVFEDFKHTVYIYQRFLAIPFFILYMHPKPAQPLLIRFAHSLAGAHTIHRAVALFRFAQFTYWAVGKRIFKGKGKGLLVGLND